MYVADQEGFVHRLAWNGADPPAADGDDKAPPPEDDPGHGGGGHHHESFDPGCSSAAVDEPVGRLGRKLATYREYRDERGQIEAPYSPGECAVGNRGFRYDCRYDSYFDTLPEEGEYLSDHWNVGSRVNLFLSFSKPRPFHEPFVFVGGNSADVAGIHRAADGLRSPAEPTYNVAAGEPDRTTVSSPALAPDGKRVVFAGDGTSPACTDIYTMSFEGGPRRLVFGCTERFWVSASNPEFTSDGRIAFDHAGDIWWVKTDGTDVRRIVDWAGGQSEPTYSGSGLLMAFSSTHNEEATGSATTPRPVRARRCSSRAGTAAARCR